MMAVVAARELADGEVVFVGIGLPNLACNLARRTHCAQARADLRVRRGGRDAVAAPVSIGDPALVTGSLMVCGMADVFQLFLRRTHRGRLSRGAQVDRHATSTPPSLGRTRGPRFASRAPAARPRSRFTPTAF